MTGVDQRVSKTKESMIKASQPLQLIPRPPHPFPQRFKKIEDGKFLKFISMLHQLSVNIPFVQALKKVQDYSKFMKYLVTKKREASF